jgi:hypothetical protein
VDVDAAEGHHRQGDCDRYETCSNTRTLHHTEQAAGRRLGLAETSMRR